MQRHSWDILPLALVWGKQEGGTRFGSGQASRIVARKHEEAEEKNTGGAVMGGQLLGEDGRRSLSPSSSPAVSEPPVLTSSL